MYNFTENITLEIPNVEEQLASIFMEAEKSDKGLILECAALHSGLTNNNTFYSKEELESALETWITPYPKPVLTNHDPKAEPLGRVIAAKMDQEDDGTPFIRLQLAVTDKLACEKIISKRYLTTSVGGKADEAICSICNENWSNASTFSAPCKHVRGKVYKGKTAFLEMKGCNFKEVSFVNMPADGRSGVKEIHTDTENIETSENDDEGWIRSARIFALSMDKEEVLEYTESEEATDILADLKKKDAANQYMQMKGAYLNALASEISEAEEEDILEISETLSDSLASAVAAEEPSTEEENTEADGDPRTGHEIHKDSQLKRAEAQEKAHHRDIDPERSTGAPLSRLSDETPSEVEEAAENSEALAELNEKLESFELQVTELESANSILKEENAKLKAALKRGLVERVIDTKINLGIIDKSDRADEIEEHMSRSAASLADSLKDLINYSPMRVATNYGAVPTVAEHTESVAVDLGNEKEPVNGITEKQEIDPEAFFTEVLMGRRKL